MMRNILGRRFGTALAAAALLVCSSAHAALINPNDTAFALPEPGPIGATLLATQTVPLIAPTFTGTLTSWVYSDDAQNPLGGLTFVYQVSNTGPNSLSRFTVSSFTGFDTDMSFVADDTQQQPTLVDRSALPGDVVGFSFIGAPLGSGKIVPGKSSTLLVVQTNAEDYKVSLASVINGSTAMAASYAPTAIVPEPSTLVLAGVGMIGTVFFARRRRS